MMDPLLALPIQLSDDPLGLLLVVSTGGFTCWYILYSAWKVIIGVSRSSN